MKNNIVQDKPFVMFCRFPWVERKLGKRILTASEKRIRDKITEIITERLNDFVNDGDYAVLIKHAVNGTVIYTSESSAVRCYTKSKISQFKVHITYSEEVGDEYQRKQYEIELWEAMEGCLITLPFTQPLTLLIEDIHVDEKGYVELFFRFTVNYFEPF